MKIRIFTIVLATLMMMNGLPSYAMTAENVSVKFYEEHTNARSISRSTEESKWYFWKIGVNFAEANSYIDEDKSERCLIDLIEAKYLNIDKYNVVRLSKTDTQVDSSHASVSISIPVYGTDIVGRYRFEDAGYETLETELRYED